MTGWRKRTIMEMAREAGFTDSSNPDLYDIMLASDKSIERFEALVRADEREACANVCETLWNTPENGMATEEESYGTQCSAAIRARGQT